MNKPTVGQLYKHFKGNYYVIIPEPRNAENGQVLEQQLNQVEFIWYQDVSSSQVWRRKLTDFLSPKILEDGSTIERFSKH
jgi:hypothetical protein